jgi:hypothetical protein
MNIKFVVATKHKDRSDTILGECLEKNLPSIFYGLFGHHISWVYQNNESLASVYNRHINYVETFKECYTHAIFMHDDIFVNCLDFLERIYKGFEQFDVIGLAGSKVANFGYHNNPMLWHLMSERKDHLGCVGHGSPDDYMYTSFGPLNKQALLIDGLFIGVNLKKLGDLRFDEKNPARFHYYDLIFSMDAAIKKLKTGVIDLPVIHQSPGLREFTEEWRAGEKYFKEKYKAYTGKLLTV